MSTQQPSPEPVPDTQAFTTKPRYVKVDRAAFPFLLPPVEPDEIGRLGNYRVLRLLGMGGMGIVFEAEDIALRRRVALKVMKPEIASKGPAGKRFLNEARAMARLHHENLVIVYQVGQEDDTLYLAMEFLRGETLESWVLRGVPVDISEVPRVAREIAAGLAAIHEHGLIHRDIKPANLWIEERTGRVKILDFGLARAAEDDTHFTQTGIIVGTPAYLSPEQARGKQADSRSDLFSLGCVLYWMCTKKSPFEADSTMSQLAALVADEPMPVQERNPLVPRPLARLIMDLLVKDPADRPPTATDVVERLDRIIHLGSTEGAPRVSPDRTDKIARKKTGKNKVRKTFWQRHGKVVAITGALSLAVISLIAGGIYVLLRAPERKNIDPARPAPNGLVAPAADVVFLKDLKIVDKVNYPFSEAMRFEDDKKDDKKAKKKKKDGDRPDFDNFPVKVQNQDSPHGIFVHAVKSGPVSISYRLEGKFKTFHARVALNDTADRGSMSPLVFKVFGDDKLLWQSGEIQQPTHSDEKTIPVVGVTVLKLQLDIKGGDIGGAHGAWFEPHLTR